MARRSAGNDEPSGHQPIAEVARTFYDRLRAEGFTHDQIVNLANDMLSLVREDLASTPPPARPRGDG